MLDLNQAKKCSFIDAVALQDHSMVYLLSSLFTRPLRGS